MSNWPVVVVTGANAGIGFGICQRLLFQLCQTVPSDSNSQSFAPKPQDPEDSYFPGCCDGITLIMACRNLKRAEVARTKLYDLLDGHIEKLRKAPGYDRHAQEFRKNVRIEVHYLDLAIVGSVFKFAEEVAGMYPYVSHLILNAGVISLAGLSWLVLLHQLFTAPLQALTAPVFYTQHKGELSVDGLGWVWQCNVFGHYVLFRSLQPLLAASKSPLGARVIWMSSLEAGPGFYQPDDWQLKNTPTSYQGSKYQIDLIAKHLDDMALRQPEIHPSARGALPVPRIRHFVAQPGVCSTNVVQLIPLLDYLKVLLFYLARFFGSVHHTIHPFKAAIGAVHLSLASYACITLFSDKPAASPSDPKARATVPLRFGAETDAWGVERVGPSRIKGWEAHKTEAESLVEKCEALFHKFRISEQPTTDFETASERM